MKITLTFVFVVWAVFLPISIASAAEPLRVPAHVVRVVDGDTIVVDAHPWPGWTRRVSVRIAGIDAPERRARCKKERGLAARAAEKVVSVIGRDVLLVNVVEGKFAGRIVAEVILSDGRSLGSILLEAGLAVPYAGGKRRSWCEKR